jgi:WD40 repeat protein
MTTFERFERDIPELMTELAPAQVPDYFDDMLQQTATHRQRPAWSYLERWLPMGLIARTLPMRPPLSWRPILVLSLLIVLITAGLIAYAGAQQERLPAPFGPAGNGPILLSTTDGDIVSIDPATGKTTPVITGPAHEQGGYFSPDGRWIYFVRLSPDQGLFVANPDGSGIRQVLSSVDRIDWIDWSQSGDRIVATGSDTNFEPITLLIDPSNGATTTLHLGRSFKVVQGRYGTDQLVLTEGLDGGVRFWVANADGTGLRQIPASPKAINEPALSSDGTKLAYATWQDGDGSGERIHVVDIDSGLDHLATPDVSDGFLWQGALFSPDGTKILTNRFIPGDGNPYRLALVPVDGATPGEPIGPDHAAGTQVHAFFSPDGSKIFASYVNEQTSWLLDVVSGEATKLIAPVQIDASWQRVAP